MDAHPDVAALAFLVGNWHGEGRGSYPTISDFDYVEWVEISAPPKPFLAYRQRTERAGTGEPLHAESGYLRLARSDGGLVTVEMTVAQPTGVVETHTGTLSGRTVHLRSTAVALTPTAKTVSSVERVIEVDGDTMRYRLLMGAVGQRHQLHLSAELARS